MILCVSPPYFDRIEFKTELRIEDAFVAVVVEELPDHSL
jgi:hypothetical protein